MRGGACFRHLNLNSNLIYTKLNYDDLYQTKPYTVGKVMMVIQRALYLKRFLRGKLPWALAPIQPKKSLSLFFAGRLHFRNEE